MLNEMPTKARPARPKRPSEVRLEYKLIHPDARKPFRARDTDAGYDLFSIDDAELKPGCVCQVKTGLCISAPPGYFYAIEGRSSLWSKGIIPFRGIIDASYTGPISVHLQNAGELIYQVGKGDRVAQMVLYSIYRAEFDLVHDFSPEYNVRGTNCFGSSGR